MEKTTSQEKHSRFGQTVSGILQWVLNVSLLILAVILVIFLAKETYELFFVLFESNQVKSYLLIEKIVVYFLYFEFLAGTLVETDFKNIKKQ